MPDLTFAIESVEAAPEVERPDLSVRLRITNGSPGERITSVGLRCQVQIEPARRRYSPQEQTDLSDLFGTPERWASTMRPLPWSMANATIGAFDTDIVVTIALPCSFDLSPGAAKYIAALREGEIPVSFLFSGTVLYAVGNGPVQFAPIPWDREAKFRLALATGREALARSGANSGWTASNRVLSEHVERCRAGK